MKQSNLDKAIALTFDKELNITKVAELHEERGDAYEIAYTNGLLIGALIHTGKIWFTDGGKEQLKVAGLKCTQTYFIELCFGYKTSQADDLCRASQVSNRIKESYQRATAKNGYRLSPKQLLAFAKQAEIVASEAEMTEEEQDAADQAAQAEKDAKRPDFTFKSNSTKKQIGCTIKGGEVSPTTKTTMAELKNELTKALEIVIAEISKANRPKIKKEHVHFADEILAGISGEEF